MSEWRHWGADMMDRFNDELKPHNLRLSLKDYQRELGDKFTLQDLLKIQEMRSKALIAAAINDFPEFLMDQIGLEQNSTGNPSIAESIGYIADALQNLDLS